MTYFIKIRILFFELACVLYFTLLYFTLLYFTLLYFTLLYFTLLYFTLLYFTLLYFTLLYFTLLLQYNDAKGHYHHKKSPTDERYNHLLNRSRHPGFIITVEFNCLQGKNQYLLRFFLRNRKPVLQLTFRVRLNFNRMRSTICKI